MLRIVFATCFAFALSATCFAQSHSPYAGFETRNIKTLSDQQISDLRAGLGMGLALAAELNGYPGPRHSIELATQLGLSETQLATANELFAAMTAESVPIGERLIAEESELDAQFAGKTVTADSLRAATEEIGRTQASLRAAHLKYHLLMLQLLTPQQVQRYNELRGYSAPVQHDPGRHGIQ
jgi:Spy/CpxP family protein refolding chaperone